MRYIVLILTLLFGISTYLFIIPNKISADLTTCSASVATTSVSTGSTTDFVFTVTNDAIDDSGGWVKVERPSSAFTINSGSKSDWDIAVEGGSSVTFANGILGGAESDTFTVNATADSAASGVNWSVSISNSPDGAGAITCSGSLGAAAVSPSITITNISVTGSATSAVITWTTDVATTSVVDYGTTSSYGQTSSSSDLATSHSVTISGLTSSTTYNYRITSVDALSNQVQSENNTFATSAASSTSTSTTTTTSSSTSTTTTTVAAKPVDTTAPSVSVSTRFKSPFKDAPQIKGRASDLNKIKKISYSIDRRGWVTVPLSQSLDTVSYSFTPNLYEDGNYEIQVRAEDESGNIGYSARYILIIDRIPPRIGGILHTIGSIVIDQNTSQEFLVLAGVPQKITLSSVGGAVTIDVRAHNAKTGEDKTFPLVKSKNTGLWSGVMIFEKSGEYALNIIAVDGVNNAINENIGTVLVSDRGVIKSDEEMMSGKVTVYYFDSIYNDYFEWDAKAYSQVNPQKLDEKKSYAFFLPAGKYYMQIDGTGHKSIQTEIFTLDRPTILNSDFALASIKRFEFGPISFPIPDFTPIKTIPLFLKRQASTQAKDELPIPADFAFKTQDAKASPFIERGKTTVISILNSWLPSASVQIEKLEKAKSDDFNTVVILPNESQSSADVFGQRGGYTIPLFADPQGEFIKDLPFHAFPAYFILNKKGQITKSGVGVLEEKDLIDL